MIAGLALAVDSQNVVGYTTVTCAAGKWYMLGAQFEDTSSTASTRVALTLQDLVQGCVGVEYGNGVAFRSTAAQIQIWDPTANDGAGDYALRFYLSDGYYEDDQGKEQYAPGWCDGGGNLVDDAIPAGYGFWFKPTSAVTIQCGSPL